MMPVGVLAGRQKTRFHFYGSLGHWRHGLYIPSLSSFIFILLQYYLLYFSSTRMIFITVPTPLPAHNLSSPHFMVVCIIERKENRISAFKIAFFKTFLSYNLYNFRSR